jgi:hypothetical protein
MFGSMSAGTVVSAVIAVILAAGVVWGAVRFSRRSH